MATFYEGYTEEVEKFPSLSKKEQQFLDLLNAKNIKKLIQHIKKSKIDYFNMVIPGLNIPLIHHALEKIKNRDEDVFYKELFRISLYRTSNHFISKNYYFKFHDSIFNLALIIGQKNRDYSLFITLINHFKETLFNNPDIVDKFSKKIDDIGLNKSDLFYIFNNPEIYNKIFKNTPMLYMNFFHTFKDYEYNEISLISKSKIHFFDKTDVLSLNWKKEVNTGIENWFQYNFEINSKQTDKAIYFVKEIYINNKDSHFLDLSKKHIGYIIKPVIEKEIIQNNIQKDSLNTVYKTKRL